MNPQKIIIYALRVLETIASLLTHTCHLELEYLLRLEYRSNSLAKYSIRLVEIRIILISMSPLLLGAITSSYPHSPRLFCIQVYENHINESIQQKIYKFLFRTVLKLEHYFICDHF